MQVAKQGSEDWKILGQEKPPSDDGEENSEVGGTQAFKGDLDGKGQADESGQSNAVKAEESDD